MSFVSRLLASAGGLPPFDDTQNLRAAYDFEAGGGATDSSGNGLSLSVVGSTGNSPQLQHSTAKYGSYAAYLNTSDSSGAGTIRHIESPANAALSLGSQWAVNFWVYKRDADNGSEIAIAEGGSNQDAHFIWFNNLTLQVVLNNFGVLGTYYYSNSLGSLPSLNAWHHVLIQVNGTNLRVFINGVQTASVTIPAAAFGATSKLWLGEYERSGWGGYGSNTSIDRLRINAGLVVPVGVTSFTPP